MDTRFKTSDIDEIGPTDGLIAYYNMDTLDGTTLLDNSGNGNNATNVGATLVSGINGNALSFNGTSNYVEKSGYIQGNGAFSVSAWISLTNIAPLYSDVSIVSQYSGVAAGERKWFFSYRNAGAQKGPSIYIVNTSNVLVPLLITNWVPEINKFYHVVAVYEPNISLKMYIDGVMVGQTISGIPAEIYNTNPPLTIGKAANSNFFPGLIDEVRIYNKALSSAEISQLYKLNAKHTQLFTDNYESSLNYSNTISLTTNVEGNNLKNDVTGNNLGVLSNTTLIDDYFNFNGTDSYINIGDNARLNTGGTISMWYYARSSGENGVARIIDKSSGTSADNGYMIYINGTTNVAFSINTLGFIIVSPSPPSFNAWHHVAVVFTSTKKEMWIDGIKVANNTNTTLPPDIAGNVYIGNRADATDRTFDGYIKNVRIYTRDLKSEEIRYLYNEGK